MFYITPLTANYLLNKKLFDKKNQNAASYTGNQLTTEHLDFYIAPGFSVTISHFLSVPFLYYHFLFPGAITYTIVVKW